MIGKIINSDRFGAQGISLTCKIIGTRVHKDVEGNCVLFDFEEWGNVFDGNVDIKKGTFKCDVVPEEGSDLQGCVSDIGRSVVLIKEFTREMV